MLQLMVIDLKTGHMVNIPMLRSSSMSLPAENPCGIHSISINPSRTLLATGGHNTNDLAVYKLPTFDPLAIGEVRGYHGVICSQALAYFANVTRSPITSMVVRVRISFAVTIPLAWEFPGGLFIAA